MNVIKIPSVNNSLMIPPAEIKRIEAISNYSRIFFADGSNMVVSKVLAWFEKSLPADMFVRVHRSHLVNKQYIKAVKGIVTKTLLMNSGEYIVVSRRRKDMTQNLVLSC